MNSPSSSMPRAVRILRRLYGQSSPAVSKLQMPHSPTASPISVDEYASRRHAVLRNMGPGVLALYPAAEMHHMSEDVPYLYHPNTDLRYLCGVEEQSAILALDTTPPARRLSPSGLGRAVLFLPRANAEKERWDGPMLGVSDRTRELFGLDAVWSDTELGTYVGTCVEDAHCRTVYLDPGVNATVASVLSTQLAGARKASFASKWSTDTRPRDFVRGPRLTKSEPEKQLLREAASMIAGGLNDAMAASVLSVGHLGAADSDEPLLPERHIEAAIEYGCKMRGASRMAFPCVVASGGNATTLHYMKNSGFGRRGDMVMVDVGCEHHGYCSDVSRSWPVSGKFTAPQKDLYELVLDVQLKCIDMCRPGAAARPDSFGSRNCKPATLNSIHHHTCELLTRGLKDLGFMSQLTVEQALTTGVYSRWYNHATGHYLGMDVHDTHSLSKDMPLQEGMCVTIEPGLYIRQDDMTAPEAFRGIGMRIEDDILVNAAGQKPEVLSHEAVKSVGDIEALVGQTCTST